MLWTRVAILSYYRHAAYRYAYAHHPWLQGCSDMYRVKSSHTNAI